MLHTGRVAQALERNRDRFTGFERLVHGDLEAYRAALEGISGRPEAGIMADLPAEPCGARPSEEWDQDLRPVLCFGRSFSNHVEARDWAAGELRGRTTFAVDGSQIQPLPDISVPVAAVQVGWFENPHDPQKPYVKDVLVEVLPPDEVFVRRNGLSVFSDQAVSLRRFTLEAAKLREWMQERAGTSPAPVAFFDGSLVVSFAERFEPEAREHYVREVLGLVETSERTRVPVVGFVDNSRARDLATMLSHLSEGLRDSGSITDADVLSPMMRWGDRTPAWVCDREGVLAYYRSEAGQTTLGDRVCFVYLKTSAQNQPARLELPRWVVEAGLVEDVVGVVRAESVAGNGYPYAIETADAVAVITAEDRRRFYSLFETFAERNGIRLRVASKLQSKYRRR